MSLVQNRPERSLSVQVMDKHLQILAKQHVETKFIKVCGSILAAMPDWPLDQLTEH